MIQRPAGKWDMGIPPREVLKSCMEEHLKRLPKLSRLKAYYDGQHEISRRQRASGMPNNRLSHGFPRYISTMASGYLIGRPVGYGAEGEEEQAALEGVLAAYRNCDVDSVDAELARVASVYGRAVEVLFADERARPRTATLDPRQAFVVYDDTVEARPLFGAHFMQRVKPNGEPDGFRVYVYGRGANVMCEVQNLTDADPWDAQQVMPNYFGGVSMIEYWNNEDEAGDFEGVLELIDAYDLLESDRMNDKQQFVDALLLLYGCTLEVDAAGRTPGQQLREDKALSLPDSDARAEWLCKQLNEADTEVLRQALLSDIHKLSMVPDLSDEKFSGNVSGVAMRYKLMGLEQLTRIKEKWFREALRERLRRFAAFQERRGGKALDADAVKMSFVRSLPVNEKEAAETIRTLHGIVPEEKLLRLAAFAGE